MTIETPRLRLRPFTTSDFEAFARMSADPEVIRYLGNGLPIARINAWFEMAAFVGHWHLLGFGEWLAEDKATGAFVGRIGLQRPEGWPATEVGWMLTREHWGKGYATEGGRAALEYAFGHLRIKRVISMIHPENVASIRVAERLGESFERRMTVNSRDRLIYSIEANEILPDPEARSIGV
ncbi:GNAT family N-acetyltransferase [Bradyrhizobium sp. LHD-71]|uniref:GNAT family N-acetyltransferase n=1 Tax=Bradyrhizobium sp. LHD-71 TaxID=3072141 RepID=UPI00280DC0B7|nr:GNAT family N-acetyltransferase [Bradyrhizobium sp. LHD-71]MDQ8727608.1 GNAT family N-acetyltransferase [Bradyrhizobium sp. LHD-71]